MKKKIFVFMGMLLVLNFAAYTKGSDSQNKKQVQESTANPSEGGGAGIKAFGEKFVKGLSDGIKKIDEEASKRKNVELTGKVSVKEKNSVTTVYLKSGKVKYVLKTITGSEESVDKLALTAGKTITVNGILNTETNVITVISYTLNKSQKNQEAVKI